MITAWAESENFKLAKEFFDSEFEHYTIIHSASSSIFQINKFKAIVSQHKLSYQALGLINRVRKEAREFLKEHDDLIETFRPRLFLFRRVRDVQKGFEYDKKEAYPRTALQLGAISRKSFDSLLKLNKRERLIVLGSLATKRTRCEVTRGVIQEVVTEEEETASVWRLIVNRVDEEMKQKTQELDADFYWVDALFTSRLWKARSSDWKERRVNWRYDRRNKFLLFSDGRRLYIAQTNLRSTLITHSA